MRNPDSLLMNWVEVFTESEMQMSQLKTMLRDDALRPAAMAMFQCFITYFVVYMAEIKDK